MFNRERSIYVCVNTIGMEASFYYKHLNITVNLLWHPNRTQSWFMLMAGRLFPTHLHGSFSVHLPKMVKFKLRKIIRSTTNSIVKWKLNSTTSHMPLNNKIFSSLMKTSCNSKRWCGSQSTTHLLKVEIFNWFFDCFIVDNVVKGRDV